MLESGSLLTQKDIVAKTYLPSRTARYALNRLKDQHVLSGALLFPGCAPSLYGLNPETLEVVAE